MKLSFFSLLFLPGPNTNTEWPEITEDKLSRDFSNCCATVSGRVITLTTSERNLDVFKHLLQEGW